MGRMMDQVAAEEKARWEQQRSQQSAVRPTSAIEADFNYRPGRINHVTKEAFDAGLRATEVDRPAILTEQLAGVEKYLYHLLEMAAEIETAICGGQSAKNCENAGQEVKPQENLITVIAGVQRNTELLAHYLNNIKSFIVP